jgi:PH/SEC7 domain-containing protein
VSETTDASPSSTRARPPRSEADRLRRELRKWQSAIDGVMDGMMDETPEAVIALDPDPDVSRGLIPEATDRSVPSSAKSSPALAAASPGARSGANFAKAVANDTFPTTSRSQTGAPEIRLHTPVVQSHPESQTQRDPDATAGLLGDPLVLDDTRRNAAPADELSPSESLQEFLERTDPTPPRSPSRASSPFARAEAVYGNSSSDQNKGSRSSIVGLSSPASVGTPSTPRPSSRIARSAELRALDALGDPELDAKAQEIAQQLWDGDESFIQSRKAAEWLGAASRISSATLRHYMSKFDFAGLRLDGAFRQVLAHALPKRIMATDEVPRFTIFSRLCGRLYLKAETQQVDRILEQFSRWYYEQNPKSPYGSLGEPFRPPANFQRSALTPWNREEQTWCTRSPIRSSCSIPTCTSSIPIRA